MCSMCVPARACPQEMEGCEEPVLLNPFRTGGEWPERNIVRYGRWVRLDEAP